MLNAQLTPPSIVKAIARRSFCLLATVSPPGRPHVAGVLYEAVGTTLYVNTLRTSRKARNIAANAGVMVCIPVRRMPVGPPSSIQFRARAEILAVDDLEVVGRLEAGQLKSLTRHGELSLPDSCFVRITPERRINTYGLGMSLWQLVRDPLHAAGSIDIEASGGTRRRNQMSAPTSVPIPPTVRRGDQGPCVSHAQALLTSLGGRPGVIDGIFGPKTDEATRTFQRGRGLAVDGIIGPHTWTSLMYC